MTENKYYHSLDFFRGLCGYGVAITHLYAFIYNSQIMEYISLLFVEFFFVLSGFVLYPQLKNTLNNKQNILIFYKRRWMRTIPLFLIVIFLVSILTNNLFSKDFFKYLTFTQKSFPNFLNNDYYPVAWSLSVEEFFYILFPLILINLKENNYIKYILIIFISLLVSKFLIQGFFDGNFFRTGTFFRFDAILFGFLLAEYKNKLLFFKNSIILTFFVLVIFYLFQNKYFILNSELGITKYMFVILLQVISGLTMFIFIINNKFFLGKKIKLFSLIISQQTYSIYLIHMIFIYILKNLQLSLILTSIIYFFSLVIFSTLIYTFIEKPILKARPKFN